MLESRLVLAPIVGACLALPVATARAQGDRFSATAGLSDFSIVAEDLRPDDGIAAQWSMISNIGTGSFPESPTPNSYWGASLSHGDDQRLTSEQDDAFMRAATISESAPWGESSVNSDGRNIEVRAELGVNDGHSEATFRSTGMFLVGAHTSLTFSGVLNAAALCIGDCYIANAFSRFKLRTLPLGSFDMGLSKPFGDSFYGPTVYLVKDGNESRSIPWQVTFANDSDTSAQISSEVFVYASVGSLTPVPEPASAASLLAGLGLLGAATRRNRPALRAAA